MIPIFYRAEKKKKLEKEKIMFTAFSAFSSMFSKASFSRGCYNLGSSVNGLTASVKKPF